MINKATMIIKKTSTIIAFIVTFLPESFFKNYGCIPQVYIEKYKWFSFLDDPDINIIFSRFILWVVLVGVYIFYLTKRNKITIKGKNYSIVIKYGDILKENNCKRVINFDECFTTNVGNETPDIDQASICGQYLKLHPELNVEQLINYAKIKPARSKSQYRNQIRYDSGTIVPNGDDLLMAFAKLDKKGKGRFFTRDEYLDCLNLLWTEIENNYSEKDVCIPILGAGTTAFDGGDGSSIPPQDLVDMIIGSYKLSSHKIKNPHKLCIVCRKNNGVSINDIAV